MELLGTTRYRCYKEGVSCFLDCLTRPLLTRPVFTVAGNTEDNYCTDLVGSALKIKKKICDLLAKYIIGDDIGGRASTLNLGASIVREVQ